MARWSLRPPVWAVLATAVGCALTGALGLWQLQRGQDKHDLQGRYLDAAVQAPLQLDARTPAQGVQRAVVSGHYVPERQLLLDNQTRQRRPGHEVWTPLRLADGALLLVNRGWMRGGGARDALPAPEAPAGEQHLSGLWRALPQPGMRVASPACAPAASFPVLVNYPTAPELACLLGESVADGVLLLDPELPGGYVREWGQVSEFPPERHYGYAAQWFAFALTLFAIFLKLNLKRIPENHD